MVGQFKVYLLKIFSRVISSVYFVNKHVMSIIYGLLQVGREGREPTDFYLTDLSSLQVQVNYSAKIR